MENLTIEIELGHAGSVPVAMTGLPHIDRRSQLSGRRDFFLYFGPLPSCVSSGRQALANPTLGPPSPASSSSPVLEN